MKLPRNVVCSIVVVSGDVEATVAAKTRANNTESKTQSATSNKVQVLDAGRNLVFTTTQ